MQDLTFFIHFIIFIVDMLFFIRQSCVRVGNRANKRFHCALRNGFTLRVFLFQTSSFNKMIYNGPEMCNAFYMDMFCFEIKAFPFNFPFMWDFSTTFSIHLNLRSP